MDTAGPEEEMCTSFVFHSNEAHIVGMNFDNNGKETRVASLTGRDLTFLVGTKRGFFPSFGISSAGIFINDLMVDDTGRGEYARQSDTRWVSTRLVQTILGSSMSSDEIGRVLSTVEVVNNPGMCSQNLIVSPDGRCWVVEHGIRNHGIDMRLQRTLTMTNFPLSQYSELQPTKVQGSGADRYCSVNEALRAKGSTLSVTEAFQVLEHARQSGDEWKTELSLICDYRSMVVHLFSAENPQCKAEFAVASGEFRAGENKLLPLTKSGIGLESLWLMCT